MKRIIFSSALALAIIVPGLRAQPKPKSQAEVQALQAMFNAQTADARIAACENVLTKFPDTEFKAVALYFEASSYEQKGDYDNTLVFGERTLQADPKYYQAMLMMALDMAQHVKEFDLDKPQKMAQINKYANDALALLKDAPKPNSSITDDQWGEAKKEFASQAHAALGMAAAVDKKYDVAESEFKTSLAATDKPDLSTVVRLGKVYADEGKYDDAIAQFDKVMATPDVNPRVRQIAQAERVRTIQKKNPPANSAPKPETPKPDSPQPQPQQPQ